MPLKEQINLCYGIQFLFNEDGTIKVVDPTSANPELCIYKITAQGRRLLGNKGLVDILWYDPFNLLCENTLTSVTFFSESYTKAMIPDRIAGNQSDLIIFYARVFKEVNRLLDLDTYDNRNLGGGYYWEPRIDTSNIKEVPQYDKDSVILYPFLFRANYYPDILKYYANSVKVGSDVILYELKKGSSFPNIEIINETKIFPTEVTFGKYNDTPIIWKVLGEDTTTSGTPAKKNIVLLSFSVLFNDKFAPSSPGGSYSNIWKDSTLRSKLNGANGFYETCFTEEEKDLIQEVETDTGVSDKVFLLSGNSSDKYSYQLYPSLDSSSKRRPSNYSSWWLRSAKANTAVMVELIDTGGDKDAIGSSSIYIGVRPVIVVNSFVVEGGTKTSIQDPFNILL